MKYFVALIVYYNAQHYQLMVYEYEKPKFEIIEHLGDGYALQEEEEQQEKEKIKEIADYLVYQSLCDPFCI
jgi:hypothetical protein